MKKKFKILGFNELLKLTKKTKDEGHRVVLCHGHFNIIHPGHLRFLNFAKKQGDLLVVSLMNQELVSGYSDDFYTEEERAEGVASLEMVDAVYILEMDIVDFINKLGPNFYIKGREFENKKQEIANEITAVEKHHGKVIFSSGEFDHSNFKTASFQNSFTAIHKRKLEFFKKCKKQEIALTKLQEAVEHFSKLNILVIGDTIVDQFISCDMLGVSSEAPVLTIREIESKEFIGGAAIVAEHIRSLGAQCTFVSVVGTDATSEFVKQTLFDSKINSFLLEDPSRPTTYKIRYMVENQKLLRVSRLKQHYISVEMENKICAFLDDIEKVDGIIISDFVYGVITEKILEKIFEVSKKKNIKVFGDVQCSSQSGDVTKFKNIELITPTEKEARIGLADQTSGLEVLAHKLINKTNNKSVVITLGSQGILAYSKKENHVNADSEYFPALEENPVDVAGAGDSVMSGYALSLCYGLNLMEASAFASCLAGISVSRIGNIPIKTNEIQNYIQEIINVSSRHEKEN
jgi:rfaE bifunctional protein kinase chain/domain